MGNVSYLRAPFYLFYNMKLMFRSSESTYTFSPITGLIHEHVVNSIHPAPHQEVYDSLRLGLGKLLGLEWSDGAGSRSPNGAACKDKIQSQKSS
jgi:hypothetical protein